jgi:hypothetical protein
MRKSSLAALRLLVALAIVSSGSELRARQRMTPGDVFYDRIAAAEKANEAGDLEAAGRAFEEAYHALSAADQATETGTDVVRESVRARKELFVQEPDSSAQLRHAEALLAEHIGNLEVAQPNRPTTDLDTQLDAIRKLLAKFEKKSEPGPAPTPTVVKDPDPSPSLPRPDSDAERKPGDRRRLGMGLALGGGVGIIGGVVLAGLGASFLRKDNAFFSDAVRWMYATDCSLTEYSICDFDADREKSIATDRGILASGVVLGAVGIATMIPGIMLWRRARTTKPASISAMRLPRGGGLMLSGTF